MYAYLLEANVVDALFEPRSPIISEHQRRVARAHRLIPKVVKWRAGRVGYRHFPFLQCIRVTVVQQRRDQRR